MDKKYIYIFTHVHVCVCKNHSINLQPFGTERRLKLTHSKVI